jgi:hypothetical protein
MRYYLIDEISIPDMEKVSRYLRSKGEISGIENIYWIRVPDGYLNLIQTDHMDCQPFFFAIELGRGIIKAEFFIRTLKGMGCSCNSCLDPEQTAFIIGFMDEMIGKLELRT